MDALGEINELDRALDGLLDGSTPGGDPVVALAARLREALPLHVSPAAWATHVAAIQGEAAAPRRGLRTKIAAIGLAAALAVSLLSASAFAASSAAAPGEALFGVKRGFERIGLAMHRSRQSRAAFAFAIVGHRMAELRSAAGTGRAERARAAYEEALAQADRLLGPESDDALLSHVEEELAKHVVVLNDLLDKVPDSAREGLQRAIDNASKAEERAARGRADKDSHEPRGGRGSKRSGKRAP